MNEILNIEYQKHTLPNGLEVVLYKDNSLPIVSVKNYSNQRLRFGSRRQRLKSWEMNMGINKLLHKLDDFLDLSKQKQEKKHNKLLKIITKLEAKKLELEQEVIDECKVDETSDKYQELSKKLNVVSHLIKNANYSIMR